MSRQTERTRAAITDAFAELVFTNTYENIKMSEVARQANVGRSTVYQHYRDKDAILLDSMDWILSGLSTCINNKPPEDETDKLLQHIWAHRDKARKILFGTTGQKLQRGLSAKIERKFTENNADNVWLISPVFVANQISAAMFSILRSWVAAEASANSKDLAIHLCASAKSLHQVALAGVTILDDG